MMKLLVLVIGLLQMVAGSAKPLSGVTYSVFLTNGCKSNRRVGNDLVKVSKKTSQIRIYGNECNQVKKVLGAIRQRRLNLRVLVGVWTRDNRLEQESETLARTLKNPYYGQLVLGVTVGNEDVFSGVPPGVVAGNIHMVRGKFRAHGLGHIEISTSEVGHMWSQELVDASDVIYANLYSFFSKGDGNMNQAAKSIFIQAKELKAKFHTSKKVVIGETGWPSGGSVTGETYAPATLSNQRQFLEYLICHGRKESYQFFVMEAFNNPKKGIPGSSERRFGILRNNGEFKSKHFFLNRRC